MSREIEILLYRTGQSIPFSEWLASLKDAKAVGICPRSSQSDPTGQFRGLEVCRERRRRVADRFRPRVPDLLRPAGIIGGGLALRWRQKDPGQRHRDRAEILEGVLGCQRLPLRLYPIVKGFWNL